MPAGGGGKSIPVLLMGDAKVRQRQRLSQLAAASLRGARVSTVRPASLAPCAARLRELDLRATLLPDWGFLTGALGRMCTCVSVCVGSAVMRAAACD